MKEYVKPMVLANEELAEGVYAASGNGNCWTVDVVSVQDWNGSHHVFEVRMKHSTAVEHISGSSTVQIVFSNQLTDAYSEYTSTFSGNTVTVTRTLLADAYQSGDTVTYKVWAKTSDEAMTKALTVVSSSCIDCDHQMNAHGILD